MEAAETGSTVIGTTDAVEFGPDKSSDSQGGVAQRQLVASELEC